MDTLKVLSIDIDFLFKDCVIYQSFQDEDLTPEQNWELIKWKYKKPFEFDGVSLAWLIKYINKTCDRAKEFVLIKEHDEIIRHMERWNCQFAECTNIDNHHDITYGNNDFEYTIENWVRHAKKDNLILNYTWIHPDLSEPCLNAPFEYTSKNWKDVLVEDIEIKYDYVVICLSQYFTPMEYWWLWDELKKECIKLNIKEFVEEKYYIEKDEYNTHFDVVNKYRKILDCGYIMGVDKMSNDDYWITIERQDNMKCSPFEFLHQGTQFIRDLLKEVNRIVMPFDVNYKSKKIINYTFRELKKDGFDYSTLTTDKNVYYFIINNKNRGEGNKWVEEQEE